MQPFEETKNATISRDQAIAKATIILVDVMRFRRMSDGKVSCGSSPCTECLKPHLHKVAAAILDNRPITFVLPAFPGKSPSPAKVLGPLPDMAERCSLEFLGQLCERVRRYHAPGARIVLCSDGRVFSDAVGMREEDVTAYQHELSSMIEELGLDTITTFNLDHEYPGASFDEMRTHLMARYGTPLEVLKEKVRRGGTPDSDRECEEAHRLYCGITRFLVEDATYPGQTRSRTAIQKDCRTRAYQVIQRSNAWGNLLADRFPLAVRLSIHPQTCGAAKLGIRLVEAETWMTPWHGVAVVADGRFILLKRSEAEAMGARLVHVAGRPSHYAVPDRALVERAA
jgi:pyoverdine/dityrosine biosynthesis protein Dit1